MKTKRVCLNCHREVDQNNNPFGEVLKPSVEYTSTECNVCRNQGKTTVSFVEDTREKRYYAEIRNDQVPLMPEKGVYPKDDIIKARRDGAHIRVIIKRPRAKTLYLDSDLDYQEFLNLKE